MPLHSPHRRRVNAADLADVVDGHPRFEHRPDLLLCRHNAHSPDCSGIVTQVNT